VDGWLVAAVTAELDRRLGGGRVQRIGAIHERTIQVEVYRPGGTEYLVLALDPELPRVHLVPARAPHRTPAPAFVQALRRHLEGARVLGCAQLGLERVLTLSFEGRDELGAPTRLALVAELTGRHANAILLGPEGRVLACLEARPQAARPVVPGSPYAPPPRPEGRPDPLVLWRDAADPETALLQALAAAPLAPTPAERLRQAFFGLAPHTAEAVVAWAEGAPGAPGPIPPGPLEARLAAVLASVLRSIGERRFRPALLRRDGLRLPSAWPLPGWQVEFEDPSPSAVAARAYGALAEALHRDRLRRALQDRLAQALARVRRRIAHQEQDLRDAADAERFRRWGELLLAFGHRVPRGAREASLPSFEDPEVLVRVPLDPARTVADNAQTYLRRYRKERRAAEVAAARLAASRAELAALEDLEVALACAESLEELEALAEEVGAPAGPAPRTRRPVPHAAREPRRFELPGGWRLYVGRSARGNDHLTWEIARPDDLWLHARQLPGSHAVLVAPDGARGAEPPEPVLRAAAAAAAYFSRGRGEPQVPVDCTRRRHLARPPGAPPGFVTYRHERTLWVTPAPPPGLTVGEQS
jgi:predicted ribosome quality control (RQC) complex YloA/Tae2 family protein